MRSAFLVPIAVLLAGTSASTASLDDLAPKTCAELAQQLARGSEGIALFNVTSHAAVDAFHEGQHEDGCRGLTSVYRFVGRMTEQLKVCIARGEGDPDNPALLAGYVDLRRELDRIDRREGCGSGS